MVVFSTKFPHHAANITSRFLSHLYFPSAAASQVIPPSRHSLTCPIMSFRGGREERLP